LRNSHVYHDRILALFISKHKTLHLVIENNSVAGRNWNIGNRYKLKLGRTYNIEI